MGPPVSSLFDSTLCVIVVYKHTQPLLYRILLYLSACCGLDFMEKVFSSSSLLINLVSALKTFKLYLNIFAMLFFMCR